MSPPIHTVLFVLLLGSGILYAGGAASAAEAPGEEEDLGGEWTFGSGGVVKITQEGDAVTGAIPETAEGPRAGKTTLQGTFDGETLKGKMLSFKSPEHDPQGQDAGTWSEVVLKISEDGRTLEGQWKAPLYRTSTGELLPESRWRWEPISLVRAGPSCTTEKKKALVVLGALTGNAFVDRAFRNTAEEAGSDLEARGYDTYFLEQPSLKDFKGFLTDSCLMAFVFVGHGGEKDSPDPNPGGASGSDTLGFSEDMATTSFFVQSLRKDLPAMEVVILHACNQGAPNNRARWRAAFKVKGGEFASSSGVCDYQSAYYWQLSWQ